ncbi:hypothetical protein C8J56DRAFT_1038917 [Mycena floridula]|nr:hypothetical protein C8J56DRAFT_1038917 [Mycena floridula]
MPPTPIAAPYKLTSHLARIVDVKATDSDDMLAQKTLLGWLGFTMSSAIPAAAAE